MIKKRALARYILAGVAVFVLAVLTYIYIPTYFGDTVYPLKYEEFIKKYSAKYQVDPSLVAAVILQESRFNPSSVSGAGAQGLMQFMPGTAATMAKETGRWPNYDIFDAETSVEFGAAHLRDLLIKYNGNVDLALYAYNTGTGNADRYASSPASIANYSYVKRIRNYQTVYQSMYANELGIAPIKIEKISDNKAEVRGFVWSQIFSNFAGYFNNNQPK
ncbi:MAG: lytic transglycosylase domain-containing protein [Patescibacteria group bacterium]|nr:lytic transglycosylase domain-containing protein [Patescibacteria group bacterium]